MKNWNVGTVGLETISREATEHYGKLRGKEIFVFCFCICLSMGSFSTMEVIYLTRRQNNLKFLLLVPLTTFVILSFIFNYVSCPSLEILIKNRTGVT